MQVMTKSSFEVMLAKARVASRNKKLTAVERLMAIDEVYHLELMAPHFGVAV